MLYVQLWQRIKQFSSFCLSTHPLRVCEWVCMMKKFSSCIRHSISLRKNLRNVYTEQTFFIRFILQIPFLNFLHSWIKIILLIHNMKNDENLYKYNTTFKKREEYSDSQMIQQYYNERTTKKKKTKMFLCFLWWRDNADFISN